MLTTLVSLAHFRGAVLLAHKCLGYGFDDIPRLTPDFE